MKETIKGIAIDLDGTWLRSDCNITERTYEAVQKAIDAGYAVIPTTGRCYRNSASVLKKYRGLRYFINANGTVLTDAKEEKVLFSHAMPYRMAKEIYERTKEHSCYVEIYEGMDAYVDVRGRDFLYASGMEKDYCDQLMSTNVVEENLAAFMEDENRKVCKFHIMCVSVEEKKILMEKIAQVEHAYPISTFDKNIEVVFGHHSKADGLRRACELLGMKQSEIMAVGDSDNDYEMISWAGLGVAMGNGNNRVRQAADYVSLTNDEDGLAEALYHCLEI